MEYSIPNRPAPNDDRDIEAILENFDKLVEDLNTSDAITPKLASPADRIMTFGTSTVTFNNSSTCAPLGVSHGLGKTPIIAIAVDFTTSEGFLGPDIFYGTRSYLLTTFTVVARHFNGDVVNGPRDFSWLAIG